jgi:hypothetical protein
VGAHVTCPVCGGGPGPDETSHWHEDDKHRFEYSSGTGLTWMKPPYKITDFTGHVEMAPSYTRAMEYWEQQRRIRNRAIADAHKRELAEHRNHQAVMGEWHEGTCAGCGMENQQVIGLPGSEYCRWCEELRVLKPAPPAVPAPAQLAPSRPVRPRLLLASLLLAVTGVLLTFADAPLLLCATLLTASFVLGKMA